MVKSSENGIGFQQDVAVLVMDDDVNRPHLFIWNSTEKGVDPNRCCSGAVQFLSEAREIAGKLLRARPRNWNDSQKHGSTIDPTRVSGLRVCKQSVFRVISLPRWPIDMQLYKS